MHWTWGMYGFTIDVNVKEIEATRRIVIEWGAPGEESTVEWTFRAREEGSTFVVVKSSGFRGEGDAIIAQALDSTGGFALVLAGAKAWLEHGIELNLVRDRHPDGL